MDDKRLAALRSFRTDKNRRSLSSDNVSLSSTETSSISIAPERNGLFVEDYEYNSPVRNNGLFGGLIDVSTLDRPIEYSTPKNQSPLFPPLSPDSNQKLREDKGSSRKSKSKPSPVMSNLYSSPVARLRKEMRNGEFLSQL